MAALDILLIDDDADFSHVTAAALREQGHRVLTVGSGAAALALTRDLRPDAVLLDLGLPGEDGFEIARMLRRQLPPTTPIIVVTGQRGVAQGDTVDLLLNKPIQIELVGGLVEYVRRRRRRDTAQQL